jgi:hypothetical protein
VKDDMRIKGVSMEMMSDGREWKKKLVVPTPLSRRRGRRFIIIVIYI